ncbi:hypothetical protein JHK87_009651 [Glycine soja]|nr:hypothetical protein JHK87_009651 [Glycine soja]
MSVLWNGEALDEFTPSRGICRGDPLSPYLFVLYIERTQLSDEMGMQWTNDHGKVILAKSVLQSLPSNVMQTTLILRLVCDVLTRSVVVSFGETHEMVQRFILFLGTTFVLLNLREVWD